MTYDPTDGQDEPRSETTAMDSDPASMPDVPPEQPPHAEHPPRNSGRVWVFESASSTPPMQGDSSVADGDATARLADTEGPNWFARNRDHRDAVPGETGVPQKETSETADRFSSPSIDPAFVHDSSGDPPDTNASPHDPEPAATVASPPATRSIVMVKRPAADGFVARTAHFLGVAPMDVPTRTLGTILLGGGVLTLIALLANGNGVALTILSAIVPLLLLAILVPMRSTLASDANLMLAITALNGVIVGGVLGWLASRIVAASWFDEGVLNFGAIGFGGHYAHDAGSAGWLVWLLCGLVFPVVALPVSMIVPAFAFRSRRFPTAENGLHQGAAAGAGLAIGTAAVFWAPLNVHGTPIFSTSDWTLMTLAVTVLSPVIAVLATTLAGIGIWRLLRAEMSFPAVMALAAGIAGMVILRLGSLAIQPRQEHLWLEGVWIAIVAIAMAGLYRWITRTQSQEA